jgi:membrane-associated protein
LMPILRTFAPLGAGVGTMKYKRFIGFSLLGNFLWITSFSIAGYLFGNIPVIKRNFTLVIFAIIIISILPPVIAVLKQKTAKKTT